MKQLPFEYFVPELQIKFWGRSLLDVLVIVQNSCPKTKLDFLTFITTFKTLMIMVRQVGVKRAKVMKENQP